MWSSLPIRILCAAAVAWALLAPKECLAQNDPNETPLGDVARNLRKTQPVKPVIDDDNLQETMQQNESRQSGGSSLRYLMSGDSKLFQVSVPDVSCSLAFTANVKSLLSNNQYSQMDLPVSEIGKLEGPATVEGDALTVTLFNATTWHVSEIAVAFTLVRRSPLKGPAADTGLADEMEKQNPLLEVRPEKKPDVTRIYRMRAPAPPWSRAAFSAPLDLELADGDEWHWAIVQAKGYPPENYTPPAIASEKAPATPQSQLASVPQNQP